MTFSRLFGFNPYYSTGEPAGGSDPGDEHIESDLADIDPDATDDDADDEVDAIGGEDEDEDEEGGDYDDYDGDDGDDDDESVSLFAQGLKEIGEEWSKAHPEASDDDDGGDGPVAEGDTVELLDLDDFDYEGERKIAMLFNKLASRFNDIAPKVAPAIDSAQRAQAEQIVSAMANGAKEIARMYGANLTPEQVGQLFHAEKDYLIQNHNGFTVEAAVDAFERRFYKQILAAGGRREAPKKSQTGATLSGKSSGGGVRPERNRNISEDEMILADLTGRRIR